VRIRIRIDAAEGCSCDRCALGSWLADIPFTRRQSRRFRPNSTCSCWRLGEVRPTI